MRVAIDAIPGEVSASVESAVRAIAAAAVSDGADADDVRERIAKAVGAGRVSVEAREKPDWPVLLDATAEMRAIYDNSMKMAQARIVALLTEAAAAADRSHYTKKLRG